MKIAALCIFLIISCSYVSGQNLIGYNYSEIRNFMRENRKDMHSNKVKNSMFSYLKYSDNSESETILFFLTPDSICSSMRVICDPLQKKDKIRELDATYKRIGNGKWIDKHDDKNYLIKFEDEEWSCTITFEPDKIGN
jgi:hypothetical protein